METLRTEIDLVLKGVSAVTRRKNVPDEAIEAVKEAAVSILILGHGLSLDDAREKVAAAQQKGLENGSQNS